MKKILIIILIFLSCISIYGQKDIKSFEYLIDLSKDNVTIVYQTGDFNSVDITQNDDLQIINQSGDANSYEFYSYKTGVESTIKVNQEGFDNSVRIYGENSLMKDITINQKANFKTITITNYEN